MTEIDIAKEIDNYLNSRTAIADFFETPIWEGIIFCLDEKWVEQGGTIRYDLGNEEEDYDDFIYSFDIYRVSRWERGGYVLFIGNDGCGNRDMYLFKSENKVEK